ncbi:MAG: molybdopterin-guanine dinucleotide biosynthesis protein B, partial [Candidatus Hodarchaeota archaeon]
MDKYIVGIVGSRNTGKTTTTVNLTNIFANVGYKVAIIKFSHHKFDLDPSHKDSAVLRSTKAEIIISSTPYETVTYQPTDKRVDLPSLLVNLSSDINVVFCESYPINFPKISLIFVCDSIEDYYQTKQRFKNENPLFITGIIYDKAIKSIEDNIILSN